VYDMLGELVTEEKISGNETKINVSNLPSGVYIVKVKDGVGDMGVVQLVKQ